MSAYINRRAVIFFALFVPVSYLAGHAVNAWLGVEPAMNGPVFYLLSGLFATFLFESYMRKSGK